MARKAKRNKWQIILCNHGNYIATLHTCPSETVAYRHFNKLTEQSDKVVYPKLWNTFKNEIVESKYEIVMLKCRDKKDKQEITKVLDETNTFTAYATNEENWLIHDRRSYKIEETFWVYGYHPKLQRKDFNWILDNLVLNELRVHGNFKTMAVYRNKLLIQFNTTLEMVICKNEHESIRLYNKIEEILTKKRLRNVIYVGNLRRSKYKREWMDKIQELTGWDRRKIKRSSTRP